MRAARPALHAMPQLVPLHVAVPLVGVGQALQDEPQDEVDMSLSHVPAQSCVPVWQGPESIPPEPEPLPEPELLPESEPLLELLPELELPPSVWV